jgi:transposase
VARQFPVEFKRDVVTVARRGDLTIPEVAADFDVSVESVRRWMRQADIDDGIRDGLTTAEQAEIVQLRRDKRRLEMENEILRRAAADSDGQRNTCSRTVAGVRYPRALRGRVLSLSATASRSACVS